MDTNKFAVPIAIVIAGAIIGGALYLSNTRAAKPSGGTSTDTTQDTAQGMRPVSADDHILGDPNAPVVIVEYSDTECPYCKQFHATLRRLIDEYGATGKVAWVYRHFPIVQLHSRAPKEAEATECANELGGPAKFWAFINAVYDQTTSNDTLDPAALPKIAAQVGLDVKAFNTCLSSGKYTAKVQADYADAIAAGGRGTPHTIIITKDGTKTPVEGAYPYEQFKPIIDSLLK